MTSNQHLNTRFHACATCRHFQALKTAGKMKYTCRRLGFETNPGYRFNCWDPKENVKKLIEKEEDKHDRIN
ncbi:hypothetical protein [Domibacillus epiphyticus]|uniref:Uncharacterized protein n=1 Tax=Domibacillus epiphyticus TaxID=1714355 RepID=A0A1V2A3V4_9BACI|nr:hypothetical protein [Domibacillus epiphyticus]OMP65661.1 hypothetical protein BTO28_16030 [Domibacillus epiphyticus]